MAGTLGLNCHVAFIRLLNISPLGVVVDKNKVTTTIQDVLDCSTEPRILEDRDIPNSIGNPSLRDYILAEAVDGFKITHIDNTMIISYDQ